MKAKVNSTLELMKRSVLHEEIPLAAPYTLILELSTFCNFKCIFCPCHDPEVDKNFAFENMTMETYKKVIDDATRFPKKVKQLQFGGAGEQTINKMLPDMIKYAKEKDIAEKITFTTNGSLLEPKLNQQLIDAGLDELRISVEALDEEGYMQIADYKIKFDKFVENIKDFYARKNKCQLYIKIADLTIKTQEDEKKFYDIFGDICDYIFIENIAPIWPDYDHKKLKAMVNEFNVGVSGQKIEHTQVCPLLFYTLFVHVDGKVSPCCTDWQKKLLIGDIHKESLYEIWQGDRLGEMQKLHLKMRKSELPVCIGCQHNTFNTRDNIDQYANEILKKI